MSVEEKKSEIKESEAEQPAVGAPNSCDHLCFHEGDRICYNDWGDKELLKRVYQDEEVISTRSSSSESQDTIHSGESLFKTFTFDAPDSDPDMKKCMAFWKGILAKNVKPAKCSLLKIKKEKVIKEKKEKVIKEKQEDTKPPDPCDNEENQKMWMDMYKDLQRRQLDKIKLGVQKKTCDPCEEYVDEEMEKKQQVEDIKKLNKWKPKHTQSTSKLNFQAQIQRTLSELRSKRSNKTQSKNLGKVPSTSENPPKSEGSASSNLKTIYNSLEDKKFPSKSSIKFPPTEQVKSNEKEEFKTTSLEQVRSKEKEEFKTDASPKMNQLQTPPEIKSVESKDSSQTEPSTSTSEKGRSSSTGFTLAPLHEPIVKEIKSNIMKLEETQLRTSIIQEPITEYGESAVIPCLCDECKCEEIEQKREEIEQKHEKICHSCDCGEICTCESCDNITNVHGTTCTCGCSMDECICEELGSKIHKIDTCPCKCGLDDCICNEFSTTCTCGDETCSCDIVDIISTYMESLVIEKGDTDAEIDVKLTREGLRFASASAQTDGTQFLPKWTLQETQQEGSYCIICGHFNCFCKQQTPCSTKK